MLAFDCLSKECPLFGPHLIEASAGTGKTFTIEHVVVRLLLADVPLEEILCVTFTRSATRELKERIRANIEKALHSISSLSSSWEYLGPFIGSQEAIFLLTQALKSFDRCQIFTIHGFCYRMLKEFSFESGLFRLNDPDSPFEMSKKMRGYFAQFWEKGIDANLLCPEQMIRLFGKYDTLQELATFLLHAKKIEKTASFDLLHQQFVKKIKLYPKEIIDSQLMDDFSLIRVNYKAHKGDFEPQIKWLSLAMINPEDPVFFRKLILHQGSLFSFLDPQNKKLKSKEVGFLHYPGFFDWAFEELSPILFEASDRKKIISVLASAWKEWEKKIINQDGIFQPDEILEQMKSAILSPCFLAKLQRRFKAVIIDEFQDTDPLQWEIFHKAFLDSPSLKALYLVGDPKQSIYRFRNADIYTYYSAKERIGETNVYKLDTNFRSSKELIDSLNVLFSRNWLSLPQTNQSISYIPVKAGSSVSSDFEDEKKALHWMIGSEEASFKESFLPFAVAEIEKLKLSSYKSVAILVKDRYELQNALDLLRERDIPSVARSHQSIAETFAFRSIRELLEAIASPQDENRRSIMEAGPFRFEGSFLYWKTVLEEKGLAKFFSEFFKDRFLDAELTQVIEELFHWEEREGFSFDGLTRFLNDFEKLEIDEGARRRVDEVEDAVQILTLHISKGLEFDIVFALALASPSLSGDEDEEELNAEKLRQLYVAMTRAKKRLYVPIKESSGSKRLSPMDLFSRQLEVGTGPLISYIGTLSQSYAISFENIPSSFVLEPCLKKKTEEAKRELFRGAPYPPSYIKSFSSLANAEPIEFVKSSNEALPRGKETGTIIHAIFEAIFDSEGAVWKEDAKLDELVEKKLSKTPLSDCLSLVQKMVRSAITQPLNDGNRIFSLRDLSPEQVFAEMEFLYTEGAHFVKGFIDLVFILHDKLYIVDWKTNVLKDVSSESIEEVMKAHDYQLQAALYAEALRRHFGSEAKFDDFFGGAFYLFVRTGSYAHLKVEEKYYG